MAAWWSGISGFEKFFWALAIPFTALFVMQMGMLILGLDNGIDTPDINDSIDFDVKSDVDIDADIDMNLNPNVPLKLVTLRNIIIFFTIFSWTGIMGVRHGYSKMLTIALGIILGTIVIVILSSVYKLIFKLTESGNMNLKNAIGATGEVYLTIPDNGKEGGKVHVIFQSSLREVPAITYGEKLKTGTKIKVIGIEQNFLVVKSLEENHKGDIYNG
ncbi:NfeD family protein [Clostridium ganghwense]|uniref:NfeD family protein n=1 Tax=Clostridium ganghwense TaxID=312089 RepID=A0ABT4CVR2_9CLOT|nr:NfeD family protein [Clostridium ganghwense]MCY6372136.1 NfeD family protein [Clostridium ganghwense]